MYLVSVYFDEKSHKRIQGFIDRVAERTGNTFMKEGNVPPHITVSAFETQDEEAVIEAMERIMTKLHQGSLTWASVGQFFPYVIFLTPVLNEYLRNMSEVLYGELSSIEGVKMSPYYKPGQWLPHATIGKTLSEEQMRDAFEVLQKSFGVFESKVIKIGLAKPNPHRDIKIWEI